MMCLDVDERQPGECDMRHRGAETFLSSIADARLRALLQHWLDLRGDRLVPERREFDPGQVAPLLSYIWICAREPATGRFRFRLAGDEIRTLLGKPVAGAYVDELFPDDAGDLEAALGTVLSVPAIHHVNGPLYRDGARRIQAERLALPVSEQGSLQTVLGATIFSWPRRHNAIGAELNGELQPTIVPVSHLP